MGGRADVEELKHRFRNDPILQIVQEMDARFEADTRPDAPVQWRSDNGSMDTALGFRSPGSTESRDPRGR